MFISLNKIIYKGGKNLLRKIEEMLEKISSVDSVKELRVIGSN